MTQRPLDKQLDDMDGSQLEQVRHDVDDRLVSDMDSRLGSADISADDEKKKYIAQSHDKNAQERAQDVPQPASDEAKNLQNLAAMEENRNFELDDQTKAHVLGEDRTDLPESDSDLNQGTIKEDK